MAGFAVVMTVLFWTLVGCALAGGASLAIYIRSRNQLRTFGTTDRRYVYERTVAPFAALLWIAAACLIHAWVSNHLAHQSVGYSPDPYVTLPNGYVVGSLNTYCGYVHAPGVETDVPFVGPGYVRGLIDLTFQGGRFEGTYFAIPSSTNPNAVAAVRRFIFDTRDRSVQTFPTDDSTSFTSQQDRVHGDVTSYWQIYAKYRHHWPTAVLWLLIVAGETAIIAVFRAIKPQTPCADAVIE